MNYPVMSGINWGEVFSAIPSGATARAMALALTPITGTAPAVVPRDGFYEIQFSAEQEGRLVEWLLIQLRREPGEIRVPAAASIALKVLARQYWPGILAVVGVGAVVGYTLKRGRGRR